MSQLSTKPKRIKAQRLTEYMSHDPYPSQGWKSNGKHRKKQSDESKNLALSGMGFQLLPLLFRQGLFFRADLLDICLAEDAQL